MADLLSSDILEEQFGPTEIVVLHQDAKTRIICTRVVSDGRILELSRVVFIEAGAKKFHETHQAVAGGSSMGKAFRADGIEFRREARAAYRPLPAGFRRWFGSDEPAPVVAVSITVGPDKTPYAEILETYSPLVKWSSLDPEAPPEKLAEQPNRQDLAAIKLMDSFLSKRQVVR